MIFPPFVVPNVNQPIGIDRKRNAMRPTLQQKVSALNLLNDSERVRLENLDGNDSAKLTTLSIVLTVQNFLGKDGLYRFDA